MQQLGPLGRGFVPSCPRRGQLLMRNSTCLLRLTLDMSLLCFTSLRESSSTPSPSELLLVRPPSISVRHHWREGRLDSVLQAVLVSKARSSESARLVTSYLHLVSLGLYYCHMVKLTLQHIQAYSSQLVYVWMIDLRKKSDFGGCHGIVVW
jgi:hypothetical protein